jgi:hypothetical protein
MDALLVVELALQDTRAGRVTGLRRAPDVVGMEVRDEDPPDPELLRQGGEGLVPVWQAKPASTSVQPSSPSSR